MTHDNENIESNKQDQATQAETEKVDQHQNVSTDDAQNSEVPEESSDENLTQEQINWRKFREERQREREEQKRKEEELKRKEQEIAQLKQVVESVVGNKSGGDRLTVDEQQQIADLMENDIPTGGEIKGYMQKSVPQIVEQILEQREQKRKEEEQREQQQKMPQILRRDHQDFDSVVSQENLDYLEYHHPEIAAGLSYMPNSVKKWSTVYNAIKKYVPDAGSNTQNTIQKNMQKPQSVTAAHAEPSKEHGYGRSLSRQEREANFKRLRDLAKQA